MAWIIGEAVVNIAVVLGLLPVLGVPLPFFSSGGTALVSSLAAIGIVLSFERESKRRHPDSQPEEKARPRTIPTDRGGARPNSQAPSPSLTKRRPERSKTL